MKMSWTILVPALVLSTSVTYGTCYDVAGVVTSIPQENASICNGRFVNFPNPDDILPETCFKIIGTGTATFKGVSVLTSVPLDDLYGNYTATPIFPLDQTRSDVGLQGFTSQAVLNGSIPGPNGKLGGVVYTKDTGYLTADGFVGQILLVVGGKGGFKGATGKIAVAGQEVGGFAQYIGQICVP